MKEEILKTYIANLLFIKLTTTYQDILKLLFEEYLPYIHRRQHDKKNT